MNTAYEPTYSRPTHIWGNSVEQWFYYTGAAMDNSKSQRVTHLATKFSTDSRGRVWRVIDPGGHADTTSFATTGLQNTTGSIAPGHRVTTVRRDALGRVTAAVNAEGITDSVAYDALNRTRVTVDGLAHRTAVDYDSLFLVAVTDAKGQRYTFAPNALGWVEQEVRPAPRRLSRVSSTRPATSRG